MKYKKLLPKHHTGKVRHHRHTSYAALSVALLFLCSILVSISQSAVYASGDPVTESSSVYAVVDGPTPTTAPAITNLQSGSIHESSDPLLVSGTCPEGTLVKLFKNEVLAGAVLCQSGRFSLEIDPFIGTNTLIARAYNNLNNSGPESAPIVVVKRIAGLDPYTAGRNLSVTSESFYRGVTVGKKLKWPVSVTGGQAPYAISIAWGDGSTDLISQGNEGEFNIEHSYGEPGSGYRGSYDVTILVTDARGNKSFIHLVSIVGGGSEGVISNVKNSYNISGSIRIAWQLTLLAALLVFSFWLGERRELRIISNRTRSA